ncbi:hypothetical protein EU97_1171 [Prochlorococcus marinus str. MIT 9311]|nr:hypothetical protein EU97_1171 [Prochlorococcus marinus str. MIT 9311]
MILDAQTLLKLFDKSNLNKNIEITKIKNTFMFFVYKPQ